MIISTSFFELNKIFCIDAVEGLKHLENNSVDLILTDPPYGVNLEYGGYVDSEENWFNLMKSDLPEIIRVSKMANLPEGNRYALEWIYKNFPPLWLIIWYKGSTGHRSPIGFNDYEPLLIYGKTDGLMMHL